MSPPSAGAQTASDADLAIRNVRALVPGEGLVDTDLAIRGEWIADCSGAGTPAAKTLHGNGLMALPGVVDLHGDAFERLFAARRTNLPVVDDDGEIVGVLTAAALQDVPPEEFRTTTVGEVATTDLPHLDGAATAAEGLYDLLGSRGEVAIVEWEGRRVGLISRGDFTAALDIRRETGPF